MPDLTEVSLSLFLAANRADPPPRHVAIVYPSSQATESVKHFLDYMRNVYAPNSLVAVGVEGDTFPPLVADKLCIDDQPTAYILQENGSTFVTTSASQLVDQLVPPNDLPVEDALMRATTKMEAVMKGTEEAQTQ